MWGSHRRPVNSPHKWPVTRKMFPFDYVSMHLIHFVLPYQRISEAEMKWPPISWQYFQMHFLEWKYKLRLRRQEGDKPLSESMMVSLLFCICVVRPQWVNRAGCYLIFSNQLVLVSILKAFHPLAKQGVWVVCFSQYINFVISLWSESVHRNYVGAIGYRVSECIFLFLNCCQ